LARGGTSDARPLGLLDDQNSLNVFAPVVNWPVEHARDVSGDKIAACPQPAIPESGPSSGMRQLKGWAVVGPKARQQRADVHAATGVSFDARTDPEYAPPVAGRFSSCLATRQRAGDVCRNSGSEMAKAAMTSPIWLKAGGKLPRSSPLTGSIPRAGRPTSLTKAAARSETSRALAALHPGPGPVPARRSKEGTSLPRRGEPRHFLERPGTRLHPVLRLRLDRRREDRQSALVRHDALVTE
jgi:hypothetical protein